MPTPAQPLRRSALLRWSSIALLALILIAWPATLVVVPSFTLGTPSAPSFILSLARGSLVVQSPSSFTPSPASVFRIQPVADTLFANEPMVWLPHRESSWLLGSRTYLPIWLLALPALALVLLAHRPRRRPGLCPHCGYDLANLHITTCPECGQPLPTITT